MPVTEMGKKELESSDALLAVLRRRRTAEGKATVRIPPGSKMKPEYECGETEVMCRAIFSGDSMGGDTSRSEDDGRVAQSRIG